MSSVLRSIVSLLILISLITAAIFSSRAIADADLRGVNFIEIELSNGVAKISVADILLWSAVAALVLMAVIHLITKSRGISVFLSFVVAGLLIGAGLFLILGIDDLRKSRDEKAENVRKHATTALILTGIAFLLFLIMIFTGESEDKDEEPEQVQYQMLSPQPDQFYSPVQGIQYQVPIL